MRRVWELALVCALGTSCQHLLGPGEQCSGIMATAGPPRTLHVRAQITRAGHEVRHEAVVQVEPERIRMIGLTPMGTQAFALTLQQGRIELDNRVGRHMGQSPQLLFDAIAHAYLAGPAPDAGTETRGDAIVDYEAGPGTRSARVRNATCGYEARITVVSDDAAPTAP